MFPDSFKISTLISVIKPLKDPHMPSSYRKIALLSCLGKLMENLIFNRLYSYLKNYDHIHIFQCWFRKFPHCIDDFLNLEHHIQLALKSMKILLLVFLT